MTERTGDWTTADEARLARLMRSLPRGTPDPAARARAFEAAQAEWRRSRARPLRGAPVRLAGWAAAVAVLAIGVALWVQPYAAPVAHLDRVYGSVSADADPLEVGARLRRGAAVETAQESGALLRYSPDLTVRLDAGTRVAMVDRATLRLDAGRVYIAVAPGTAGAFVVRTALGDVRHVGTRYAVSARDGELEVAVREGEVRIDLGARAERATAGEALRIDPEGAILRAVLSADDARWAWIDSLPSPVAIEGRTLVEFLQWYAVETGRRVDYADDATRARAQATILHGSVDGLAPAQALAIVASSADVEAILRDGQLVIGPARR
ncbi:MAG TPA: FecR family protein [Steroidobacteraceae bacterium]|nr:FecR family protein [Steroidobacteraceae bacterium]